MHFVQQFQQEYDVNFIEKYSDAIPVNGTTFDLSKFVNTAYQVPVALGKNGVATEEPGAILIVATGDAVRGSDPGAKN